MVRMKRKILFGIGSLLSIGAPITAISCGCSSQATKTNSSVKSETNKSEILKIKDNTAIVDLTTGANAQRDQKVTEDFDYDNSEFQTRIYIDETYPAEVKAILDWASEMKSKNLNVKIAFRYHHPLEYVWGWVMKLN